MNGWDWDDAKPGKLFGLDRSDIAVRLAYGRPPPRRSLWTRLRDACRAFVDAWRWGPQ